MEGDDCLRASDVPDTYEEEQLGHEANDGVDSWFQKHGPTLVIKAVKLPVEQYADAEEHVPVEICELGAPAGAGSHQSKPP
jgi:hypothetical protein